jgi:SAM-dependent methyltransferase
MTRTDIINHYCDLSGNRFYLEIGTSYGHNFKKVNAKYKVGIDLIAPRIDGVFPCESDRFFAFWPSTIKFDVIFIDGDHSHEQSLRDLQNAIKFLTPYGVIIMHDCMPDKEEHCGEVKGDKSPWYGDVYKTFLWARQRYFSYCKKEDCGCGCIFPWLSIDYQKPDIPEKYTFDDYLKHRTEWMGVV